MSILNRLAAQVSPKAVEQQKLASVPIFERAAKPQPQAQQDDNELVIDLAGMPDFAVEDLPILSEFDEFNDDPENTPPIVRVQERSGLSEKIKLLEQFGAADDLAEKLPDFNLPELPPLPHEKGKPYEDSPRIALIRMVQTCQHGDEFRCKAPPGKGRDYLQAMRQVLSRARAQSIRERRPLTNFKLFCEKIIEHETHDELVLYRGARGTGRKNAYSDLLGLV